MADGTDTPGLEERVAALEATVATLTRKLLTRGDITINDARAAHGLPPFHEVTEAMAGLAFCGDPIKDGCKHVMTGGCSFECFRGPCVFDREKASP